MSAQKIFGAADRILKVGINHQARKGSLNNSSLTIISPRRLVSRRCVALASRVLPVPGFVKVGPKAEARGVLD